MIKSPAQVKAQKRNSAKWIVTGAHRGLRKLMLAHYDVVYHYLTKAEHEDIKRIAIKLTNILDTWDYNNKKLGIGGGK